MKVNGIPLDNDSPLARAIAKQHPDTSDKNTERKPAKPERGKESSLVSDGEGQTSMVHISGQIHCRIIRVYSGRAKSYDDDNLSGGCKELRDSIAAMLGLKGDSKEDGITFAYEERKGEEAETIIELFCGSCL